MKLESHRVQCFSRKLLKAAVSSLPPPGEVYILSVQKRGWKAHF